MSEEKGSFDGCIFCEIVAGAMPAEVVDADERTVAFLDVSPATPGHALVIPRAHAADLYEISNEDLAATIQAAKRLAERMRSALGLAGVNLLNSCGENAWQTVFHFHIHVVPRYADDPLKLPWLPDPGQPNEIAAVAAKLRGDD